MIEDELRATFGRHEALTPAAGPLLASIEEGYRRRRRVRRALRIAGAGVVTVAVLAVPAFAAGTAHRAPGPAASVPVKPAARPVDYLVVGTDGGGVGNVLLVHVPARGSTGYLVTLPLDRLAPAYRTGGFRLLTGTVTELTGVTPTAGALVRFDALRSVVDALGGLDLCVDEKTMSVDIGHTGDDRIQTPFLQDDRHHLIPVPGVRPEIYDVGCRHLEGWQVLDYARQWMLLANGDGDAGRQRHVRQVLAALFRAMSAQKVLVDPVRAHRVLQAAGSALTLDSGGRDPADLVSAVGRLDRLVGVTVPADASALFQALRDDGVAAWVSAHPEAVNP